MDPCLETVALARAALSDYHTQHSLSLNFQHSLRETSPQVRSKLLRFLRPSGFTKRRSPTPEYVLSLLDKSFVGRPDNYIPQMCRLGMEVSQQSLKELSPADQCKSAAMAAQGGHLELLGNILSLSTHEPRLTQEMVHVSVGQSLACDEYLLQHYSLDPQKALMAGAKSGNAQLVEFCVPQTLPEQWEDAMWEAAAHDHVELVKMLLSKLEAGPSQWRPIVSVYSPQLLTLLLKTYAPALSQATLNALLFNATKAGDVALFELLTTLGAQHQQVHSLAPALGMSGSMDMLRHLQALTKDLVFWQRTLTYAARKGHLEMVIYLAEWLEGDYIPGEALLYAVLYQHSEVLSVLLAATKCHDVLQMAYLKKVAAQYGNIQALELLEREPSSATIE